MQTITPALITLYVVRHAVSYAMNQCIGVYVGWDVIRPRLPPNATHVGDKLWEMSMDLIRPFLTQPTEHHHNHHVQ